MNQKIAIRKALKARRGTVPAALAARYSTRLVELLRALLAPKPRLRLGVFWPLPGEPDLRPLIAHALRRGAHVVLPAETQMAGQWRWRRLTVIVGEAPTLGDEALPQVALVPGLGFDLDGRRLGFGHGIYDRLLAATQAVAVGVAFPVSIVPKLPSDAWDVSMHLVATPFGIHVPGAGPAGPRRSTRWNP